MIRKKKTVKYALDTFNKGRPYLVSKGNDEILFIYDKLTELSETGEIEKFFDGDDVIDNPMTIYTYDYKTNQIIEKFTERGKCEWPNTTTSGEIIYENTHYEKREDCVESELRQQNYKIENCENRIEDYQEKLENAKAQLEEAKDFIKRETL